jgi:hypothetical protein
MAEWSIAGTYLETCNCDPGCGCNFRGLPTSPEGNCEAFLGHVIETGERDGLEWLEAKPREKDAGFDRIRMGFGTGGIQAMELTDHFGQTTTLRFAGLVRNPKVDPSEFRFEPPKGADVLGEK